MLACSCLSGFCRRGGGLGGGVGGGWYGTSFQSSIGMAVHTLSSLGSLFWVISFSGIEGETEGLGIVLMLRVQSSTLIFPLFHEGNVEGSGVSVCAGGIGMNSKCAIWTLRGAEGCDLWKSLIASSAWVRFLSGSQVHSCRSG